MTHFAPPLSAAWAELQEQQEAQEVLSDCFKEKDLELLEEAPEEALEGEQVQEQQQEAEQEPRPEGVK